MNDSMEELYQDLILDHFKHPRCKGCVAQADAESHLFNPLCGDEIELTVKVDGEQLKEVAFDGHGCSISQASASMMGELCSGMSLEDVSQTSKSFRQMMEGVEVTEDSEVLGDAVALQGVKNFPTRIKCAMLAWEALEQCLQKCKQG